MRSVVLGIALFVLSGVLLVQPSQAWVTYQAGSCWAPECQVPCPRGYTPASEWSLLCERVNASSFGYYAYPLLNPQGFEGNVFQHHVSAWGYGPDESALAPGRYRVTYTARYPVWVNPVQQAWNTKRSIYERKTVVHVIPEPGEYAVGLSDDSVQHIPMESVGCDDWMWDGCPTQFTVWYRIQVRDGSGALVYDAKYPQLFEAAPVQP